MDIGEEFERARGVGDGGAAVVPVRWLRLALKERFGF